MFGNVNANASGRADFNGAVAPGFWRFQALANWDGCTGQFFSSGVLRGDYNYFVCTDQLIQIPGVAAPLSPRTIDTNSAQVQFTASAENINNTYGMPTFQFINEYGTFVAQVQASTVSPDGFWATGWSGCMTGLPTGNYTVRIVNATADGTGQIVGLNTFYLYGGPILKAIDDNSFFVRQQYLDFLGREPDASGWQAWIDYVSHCGTDIACRNQHRIVTVSGFINSGEFRQRIGGALYPAYPGSGDTPYNREFIQQCYIRFLDRTPGLGEDTGWQNYLFSTGDYNGVIEGFINSDEYRTRFDPEPEVNACNPTEQEVATCEQWDYGSRWDWNSCSCVPD